MDKKYWVYIVTNKRNGTLYVGMTGDLAKRIWQHKQGGFSEFTSKFKLKDLVYFEEFDRPMEAIEVEKKIKGWKRFKKLELIEKKNPEWKDLSL